MSTICKYHKGIPKSKAKQKESETKKRKMNIPHPNLGVRRPTAASSLSKRAEGIQTLRNVSLTKPKVFQRTSVVLVD